MVLWELSIGYSQTGSLISRTLTKDKFCQPNRLVIFIYKMLRNKSDSP